MFKKIVVFGGTGKQGFSVVEATNKYDVSILTRKPTDSKAIELAKEHNVNIIEGSYAAEEGLRKAFAGQEVCYFNIDSFNIGEPQEYFWTFRAYEIAVQSGLQWFIYAGAPDRFASYNFDEKYRNSHNVVSGRLSSWLASQPTSRLPWSIVTGGIYAEMLGSLLRPTKVDGGFVFSAPVLPESVIPLIPLENYGKCVVKALEHPEESIGKFLDAGSLKLTYPEIARAVENATGVNTSFVPITIDEWMERISQLVNPDNSLPIGADKEDPTTFTFRRSFTAWWALWSVNGRDEAALARDSYGVISETPNHIRLLENWLRKVNYSGNELAPL